MVMVGDGATDMEAKPPADGFIGFGGNKVRETVRKQNFCRPQIIVYRVDTQSETMTS